MPAFRNLKSRRSSGMTPLEYDEYGWERIPRAYPFDDISQPFSRSSSSTPPLVAPSSHHLSHKVKPRDHIPRPRNAFIFFRSYFNKMAGGHDQNQVSVRAGKAWNDLSDEERRPFTLMAAKEKLDHRAKFPNYTYTPGNKGNGNKRKGSTKKKAMPAPRRVINESKPPSPPLPSPCPRCDSPSDCALTCIPPTPSRATANETFLDLTVDEKPEPIFTPNWSFIPTSQIPPLRLPPPSPRTIKKEEVECPLPLPPPQPPSLNNVAEVFEPKCEPEPFLLPQLNYEYDDIPPFLDHSHLVGLSQLHSNWTFSASESMLPSEMDAVMDCAGAGKDNDAFTPLDFETMFANIEKGQLALSYPLSFEPPITRHEEIVMTQFVDFDSCTTAS